MKIYCGFGWKLNTPTNLTHLEEVAYALAVRDFKLRTNGSAGASQAMMKGVERFCNRRKKKIDDYLEVYINKNNNLLHSDLPGVFNIHQLENIEKATKILEIFCEKGAGLNQASFENLKTVPYMLLGKDLTEAPAMVICDVKGYSVTTNATIEKGSGTLGICIRLLNKLAPNTMVFNYDFEEHRKRINTLLYNAKN